MNSDIQFILTKEYKKFEEFCNSCKDYRYIGLCYGISGIGKTLSAIKYAYWNETSDFYDINFKKMINDPASLPSFPDVDILHCDTILMTAAPTNTPSRIDKMISSEAHKLNFMCLQIRYLFGLKLRQSQGFINWIFMLSGLPLTCPDYTIVNQLEIA